MAPPCGPDSLPGRISERRLRSRAESCPTLIHWSPRQDAPTDGQPHPAGDPANDNKTAFIKFLDTGFSFGVEDREILFYRVKPLFPERRWHGTHRPRWRGQSFKGPKRDNSGRRGKQNG